MMEKSLGHYRILEKIGEGGMGEVFLAEDTSLQRRVAVKFLPQQMQHDEAARRRFEREAHSAAVLNHPYICSIHEVGEAGDRCFIVMEFVDGLTLKEKLEQGPIPLRDALQIGVEVTEALEAAHQKAIVHRDIKPANIMLARAGHAKVMDFGLAKQLFPSGGIESQEQTITALTREGSTVGTLAYMSPEQLRGEAVDARSDVFSLGIVLYEMLAGSHPFRKKTGMDTASEILTSSPQPLTRLRPETPADLSQVVARALEKNPNSRYPSAHEMRKDLSRCQESLLAVETGRRNLRLFLRQVRRPRIAVPVVTALLAIGSLGYWILQRQARIRWAREEILPEVERLVEKNDVWRNLAAAYSLAERAEEIIPDDGRLASLFSKCSVKMNIRTEPSGAKIFFKEYETPDSEWRFLGVSPLEGVRVPIGIFRWKIEKAGYETVSAAAASWDIAIQKHEIIIPYDFVRVLDRVGSVPPGMVRVPGGETKAGKLPDFYIDRFEVTNREYKKFVDNGGYKNRRNWKQKLVKGGRELSWEEVVSVFVDQTNQPGPATWQAGDYPEGQGDYPVSGISWYEAAAYAEFAGKELPTGEHWGLARGEGTPMIQFPQLGGIALFAPYSNFKGKGPVQAGTLPGITPYGAFDMAGNVREWCWNETAKGRLLRGGAWDDNTYMFEAVSQAPALDRSVKNGFRCALYPGREEIPRAVFEPAAAPGSTLSGDFPDFYKEKPVPDSVFQAYKEQFSYDRTDLSPRVEKRHEGSEGWIHEEVTFNAAYGNERVIAHLFLPRNARPPYQTVIYYPGDASFYQRSSEDLENYYEFPMFLSFIVKNGRAVLYPVYKGTFERGNDSLLAIYTGGFSSRQFTEVFVEQQVKDAGRCIDYLETRNDIDAAKVAFYGMSQGGVMGPFITAVEDRFKASILMGAGLVPLGRGEGNQLNYVPRVKVPTLILNGRYDTGFVPEKSAKPLFDLLGTPARDKQLRLYETDHIPPRNEFIKEILAWLDRYLGRVR